MPHEVTQLLAEWSSGDESALNELLPLVEKELHRLAHHYMSRERAGHTLQTTALINEAYLRLAHAGHPQFQNRAHFFAVAANLMRQIMLDHARARQSAKRGGLLRKVSLDEAATRPRRLPTSNLITSTFLRTRATANSSSSRAVT